VTFEFPAAGKDAEGKTRTVRPEDGDRYAVVRDGEELGLRKR
jgi:hypothetical protein